MLAIASTEEDHDPSVSARTGAGRRWLRVQLLHVRARNLPMLKGNATPAAGHGTSRYGTERPRIETSRPRFSYDPWAYLRLQTLSVSDTYRGRQKKSVL